MKKTMPVLDEQAQRAMYGGNVNSDCWWHCMAYVKSCGTDYSDEAARDLACSYYGDSFNPNDYAFEGTQAQHNDYISDFVTGVGCGNYRDCGEYCDSGTYGTCGVAYGDCGGYDCGQYLRTSILIYDPNLVSGELGLSGQMHAVIITEYGQGYWEIFDPSTGESGIMNPAEIAANPANYVIHVR